MEASIKETEAKLCEALERCAKKDSEAKELNERLLAFETQLKTHEEHANEAASFAENSKAELEDAILKIQNLERSVEETKSKASHFENEHELLGQTNLSLSQKIAEYETKVYELEGMLKTITAEREDASVQLQSSNKAIEDLSQQLFSEREKTPISGNGI
ncbi:hypothetical protein KFK09_013354 [Dendrobium nobile]|uniref:Uncharacterized protein n=1 Tax=Dendrobium nobile TaxID=94219 RepID=A0A8T3B9D3_DENNO|nr:hypothetical protein KFK09_013354 [Dendrobium nobile]